MSKVDQGYESIAKKSGIKESFFSFGDAMAMQKFVWEAAGCSAFTAPNGNMIHALVNLAVQEYIKESEGK